MSDERKPDVTVALLTRNAGPLLERLLGAVRAQETSRAVEIVAIDSGSTDETLETLARHSARVTSITAEAFNFGRTRDRVFEEARAPIVINLSQDAIPAHGRWLENLIAPFSEPGVAASCGRSVSDPARDYAQFPWERNGYFYFTREMKKFGRRYGRGLSNANSAIRRTVWEQIRFGDASIGEDYRFQTRLRPEDGRIVFPNDAPVLHHHNYTAAQLYKRCRNEGMGLREMGCDYTALDLAYDLLSPRKYWVWLRELVAGRLTTAASLMFPVARPVAVYVGSRFGRSYLR